MTYLEQYLNWQTQTITVKIELRIKNANKQLLASVVVISAVYSFMYQFSEPSIGI
jgi:hypothetical protein